MDEQRRIAPICGRCQLFRRLKAHLACLRRKGKWKRSADRILFSVFMWTLVATLLTSLIAGVRQSVVTSQRSERVAEPAPIPGGEPLKLASQSEDDR